MGNVIVRRVVVYVVGKNLIRLDDKSKIVWREGFME